jgi:uncharacterized membrane protein YidH (DUF202 family)
MAYLLRGTGLAITLGGLVVTIASLSQTWVKDSSGNGPALQSGWHALSFGDLAVVGGCLLVAILAIALTAGPRSRKVSRTAGGFALTILGVGLAGVAVVDWLVGLDFSFFSDSDAHRYSAGPGFQAAEIGLGVAVFGLLVLLAGRWDARTRRALRREANAPRRPVPVETAVEA